MKLKKLLVLSSCVFLLVGCGSSSEESSSVSSEEISSSEPPATSSVEPEPVKPTTILDDDVINQNVNVNKKYSDEKEVYVSSKIALPSDAQYSVYEDHINYGVAIVSQEVNEVTTYGIYSYLAGKLLVGLRLVDENEIHFQDDQQFGSLFTYYDVDEKYYIADGAGNILYSSYFTEVRDYLKYGYSDVDYFTYEDDDSLYSSYETQDRVKDDQGVYQLKTVTKYFKYNDKGVAEEIEALPNAQPKGKEAGDIYLKPDSSIDLSELGLERYYFKIDNKYIVYSKSDDKLLGEINLPYSATNVFTVGTKLYYQVRYSVAYDATDYSYLDTSYGSKYKFETYRVDFATLETTQVSFPAYLSSAKPFYDKDGLPNYVELSFYEVRADKTQGEYKVYLADADLTLYDDVTLKNYYTGVRLSNGNYYYNYRLYSKTGELIADGYNLRQYIKYDAKREIAVAYEQKDTKNYLVVVNNEGKLLVPEYKYRNNYYYNEYLENNNDFVFVVNNIVKLYSFEKSGYVYYDLDAMQEVPFNLEGNEEYLDNLSNPKFVKKTTEATSTSGTVFSSSVRQFDKTANLASGITSYGSKAIINFYEYMGKNFYGYYYGNFRCNYYDNTSASKTDYYLVGFSGAKFNAKEIAAPTKVKRVEVVLGQYTNDNAVTYAWAWKDQGAGQWYELHDSHFKVPTDCNKIVLVRFAAGTLSPNWETKLNQTEDLDITAGKVLTFISWGASGAKDIFSWVTP